MLSLKMSNNKTLRVTRNFTIAYFLILILLSLIPIEKQSVRLLEIIGDYYLIFGSYFLVLILNFSIGIKLSMEEKVKGYSLVYLFGLFIILTVVSIIIMTGIAVNSLK